MQGTCVRPVDLPNTSRLAADVLRDPERTSSFYRHPLRTLESFRDAAREIDLTPEARAKLLAVLRLTNPPSPALERLAQPGTVVVATGQQVGLFSGPSYTIYKALHAARLAAWLSESGIPAVPVFWLATEDHDFAEVNHVWVFDANRRPVKLEVPRTASAQPVGEVPIQAAPVGQLRDAFSSFPFGEDVAAMVANAYAPGRSMGEAFGRLLRQVLSAFDIPHVDPMLPAFRELVAPTMRAAVDAAPEIASALAERNRDLAKAGYHAQVHVEEQTSLVFLLDGGKRIALRRHGRDYMDNGRRLTSEELMDRAAHLSPNALLRPVVQDSVLPTVAYIGGPAEVAYLAQSQAIYRNLLGRMPVAVPRAGFTLVDARSRKLLDRYGLDLPDFYHGEESLRARIASRLVPPGISGSLRDTAQAVDTALVGLRRELAEFDPTLVRAFDKSSRKIRYQLGKIEGKTGREAMRRDARAADDAKALYGLIYPERHLQERLYSFLPFLAMASLDLPQRVYEAIDLECPEHRVIEI